MSTPTFPLSHSQRSILIDAARRPGTSAYTLSATLRSSTPLDLDRLEKAFGELQRKHPLLMARLVQGEGILPVWTIGEPVTMTVVDAAEEDPPGRAEQEGRRFADSGPFFSLEVKRRPGGDHDLSIRWHHLIGDAWSLNVMLEDFKKLYYEGASECPAENAGYDEFSAWSLAYPDTDEAAKDVEYWRSELSGSAPFWDVPTSKPRPKARRDEVGTHRFGLPGIQPSTAFETALAAYLLTLAKCAGRNDASVAIPLLGRPSRSYHRTFGHFVNMAVVRVDIAEAAIFEDLVRQVRTKVKGAAAHGKFPFTLLPQRLGLDSDVDHAPATDAYCGMIRMPAFDLGDMRLAAMSQQDAQWDIAFEILRWDDVLEGSLRYPRDLWDEADIRAFADRISAVLEKAARDPLAPIEGLVQPGANARPAALSAARAAEREKTVVRERAARPATETETKLLAIWREVLENPELDIRDDFFESGGHSLKAVQVASRVLEVFGKRLPLGSLFEHRTIEALAKAVDGLVEAGDAELAVGALRERERGTARVPLSFSQTRMWFMYQLEPSSVAYNMHASIRIRARLDAAAFEGAVADLERRHEILRSTFDSYDGVPAQVVHAEPAVSIETFDLSGMAPEEATQKAEALVKENANAPFVLERDRPYRFRIIKLAEEDHVLSIAVHHIAADQWSWGILSRDISAFYSKRTGGASDVDAENSFQYRDFCSWEEKRIRLGELEGAGSYWKEKLRGVPPLELPTDRPRPKERGGKGTTIRRIYGPAEAEAVEALARRFGCTPYVVLLACFAVLMRRYSGMDDFAVGSPSANRDRREFEGVVGTFVNTLAFRFRFRPGSRFAEVLDEAKRLFLEGIEHRAYPFEKLVEELNPVRDSSRSPLVQVLFNMFNAPISLPFSDLGPVEPFDLENAGAQFDFSLNVDVDFFKEFRFIYDEDLFDGPSVEGMADAYLTLLKAAAADPDAETDALPLMDAALREKVAVAWNSTGRDYDLDRTPAELIWETASKHPGKSATIFYSGEMTYAELIGRASAVARMLELRGVGPGDLVGIHMPRGPLMLASMLGTMARGAAYLPMDTAYPKARLEYMLEQSGATLRMTTPDLEGYFGPGRGGSALVLAAPPPPEDPVRPVRSGGASPAYVLYTSGSTGQPKGVVVPNRALVNFLLSMREVPGCSENDKLLSVTPMSFDISGLEYFLPLISGATLVLPPREDAVDPAALMRIMRENAITMMQATPATWRMLLESGWEKPIRTILCGGEAFHYDLVEPMLQRSQSLWNMYGPTETTIWSTAHRVVSGEFPVPIGKPIANTQIYILDAKMEHARPGIFGDVYIAGAGLALGYRGRDDLTSAAFVPQPWDPSRLMYRTGDRGRYRQDGAIEYAGRVDGQVKIHGHRIELQEIEGALSAVPGVKEAVCAVKEPVPGDPRIVAYIVPSGVMPQRAEFEAALADSIPAYMMPSAFMSVEAIPLTSSGKVDRKALPVPEADAGGAAKPPSDDVERRVLAIWEEALGCTGFGVDADFFSLGGHSLLAVRVASAVSKAFGVELTLRALFSRPTVEGCARLVRKASTASGIDSEVVFPMLARGSGRPVFIVAGVYADENGMYRYLSTLVHHLGPERPVYGIRPRGLIRPAPVYGSVEEIADDYIREMRKVQPEGPYTLIGECVGGIAALEVARKLESAGVVVDKLVLMDTEFPRPFRAAVRAVYLFGERIVWKAIRMFKPNLRANQQLRTAFAAFLKFQLSRWIPSIAQDRGDHSFDRVQKKILSLASSYRIKPYRGKIDVLVNEEDNQVYPGLGWQRRKRRGLSSSVTIVRGSHVSRLTMFGPDTGAAIRRILEDEGPGPQ